MSKRVKLVRHGQYAAEVAVELIESAEGWGPYLSIEDAGMLDRVRVALRDGDLKTATQLARVYRLTPISVA